MEEFNILLIVEDKYNLLSIKIPLMQKITDPETPTELQMCEDHRRTWTHLENDCPWNIDEWLYLSPVIGKLLQILQRTGWVTISVADNR